MKVVRQGRDNIPLIQLGKGVSQKLVGREGDPPSFQSENKAVCALPEMFLEAGLINSVLSQEFQRI